MKDWTRWIGTAAAALLLATPGLGDETTVVDEVKWSYSVASDDNATVTGADPCAGPVRIPQQLDGHTVTGIGGQAFLRAYGMTGVEIPEGVTNIESMAFMDATNLATATLPTSLRRMGASAFMRCSALTAVTLPTALESLGETAFAGCAALTGIEVAEGNARYGSADGVVFEKRGAGGRWLAVYPGGKAGAYAIPEDVTALENGAFEYAGKLTSVAIPGSVTNIGWYAFANCEGLASVDIPASVQEISGYAFQCCSSLTNIAVAAGNARYESVDGVLYEKTSSGRLLRACPGGIVGTLAIPAGTTAIEDCAFYDCVGLAGVTFPDGLTDIGSRAFLGCLALADVRLPDSVKTIGSYVFERCGALTNLTLSANLTALPQYMCVSCTNLASLTIPDQVAQIGFEAFNKCTALTTLTLPPSVENLEQHVFSGTKLERLYVDAKWEGTDFLDGTSVPEGCTVVYYAPSRLTRVEARDGEVRMGFVGKEGTPYRLERAAEAQGPWAGVATVTAGAGETDAVDAAPPAGRGFYRMAIGD